MDWPRSPETRDRIRDAAVELFGRVGFTASLRSIATEAEVSAAAIVKNFGSKEELRRACDEHVLATIREAKSAAMGSPDLGETFLSQLGLVAEFQPILRYCIRSLQAGGEVARGLIEQLTVQAVDYLRMGVAAGNILPSRDEEARVRFLTGASLGWLMLAVVREGRDIGSLDQDFWERTVGEMLLPALELYTEGLLTDASMMDRYLRHIADPPATATTGPSTSADGSARGSMKGL